MSEANTVEEKESRPCIHEYASFFFFSFNLYVMAPIH